MLMPHPRHHRHRDPEPLGTQSDDSHIEQPPESVAALVPELAEGDTPPVVSLAADMNEQGQFSCEWLIATNDRLFVISPSEDAKSAVIRMDKAIDSCERFRVDNLVGGGALLVLHEDTWLELARFTNAKREAFSHAAGVLNARSSSGLAHADGQDSGSKDIDRKGKRTRCPNCGFYMRAGSNVCPRCLNKTRVILRIFQLMTPYWGQMTVVWALLIVTMTLGLIPPYLSRPLIDRVLSPMNAHTPDTGRYTLLGILVLTLLGSRLLGLLLGIVRGRIMVRLGSRVAHSLRHKVFDNIERHSLQFFDRQKTGDLMSRVSNDTSNLERVIIQGVETVVVDLLAALGIGIMLFVMNWKLAILIAIPIPIVVIASRLVWRQLFKLFRKFWSVRGRLNAMLNDNLSGIRVVKAFAREGDEIGKFDRYSMRLRDTSARAETSSVTRMPALAFLATLGTYIVWYMGGRNVIAGTMTTGTLMAFLAYIAMFNRPLNQLTRITDWFARSLTAAQRLFEIIDTPPDVPEPESPVSMPRIEGRVQFENVTFGYNKHSPVIKSMCIDVEPGEMIGLVGHSGAGKSTTINLLCRFYDPDKGSILIDGIDVRRIRQHDLRSQLGVVLQDTFLFNGTIAENISFSRPEAGIHEIVNAARAANAHEFILNKPDGYDTVVGERGVKLSGGERQRISIARAILHDPRILILDEATSCVDTDTEQQIQEAIARLVKGRTTFAIAHRLSTLRNADRLLVLKNGEIMEMGTHDELLSSQGEFYRLVQIQKEISKIDEIHT